MSYKLRITSQDSNLTLEGSFTFADSEAFCQKLMQILKQQDQCEVHVDVRNLDSVDATGLGLMLKAHDVAKKRHLKLIFEHPEGQVREALDEASRYNALNIAI